LTWARRGDSAGADRANDHGGAPMKSVRIFSGSGGLGGK
jgi:hypothetical protein